MRIDCVFRLFSLKTSSVLFQCLSFGWLPSLEWLRIPSPVVCASERSDQYRSDLTHSANALGDYLLVFECTHADRVTQADNVEYVVDAIVLCQLARGSSVSLCPLVGALVSLLDLLVLQTLPFLARLYLDWPGRPPHRRWPVVFVQIARNSSWRWTKFRGSLKLWNVSG